MSYETKESAFNEIALQWLNGNKKDAVEFFDMLSYTDKIGFVVYFMSDDCSEDLQIDALQLLSRHHRELIGANL